MQMNCHPDRSVAKWRDLLFACPACDAEESLAVPFVIPSEAEGSAVLSIKQQKQMEANRTATI
jgi:hypothetical protein